MATHKIKVMYEGTPAKASPNADPGLTSGGATIYEIMNVPANLSADDVLAAFIKNGKSPKHKDHEVQWADLASPSA